jgi:uncharacterized protein (UPF0261 family)
VVSASTLQTARVVVLATMDTKAEEARYLVRTVRSFGHSAGILDMALATPQDKAADSDPDVLARVGLAPSERAGLTKSELMEAVARQAAIVLLKLISSHGVDGILGLGGGHGTWLAVRVMREAPFGMPKTIVTTGSQSVERSPATADITLIPSITDIAGLNSILTPVLHQAGGAMSAAINARKTQSAESLPVGMTMFGVTTMGADRVRQRLTAEGLEVAVFHANGLGGAALERLVSEGRIGGVLDWTTTELADELTGGCASAGPGRLTAAGHAGLPQVFVPGAMDVINFRLPEAVPPCFSGRTFHAHTPAVTLMRTSAEESRELGEIVAAKLNKAKGPVRVLIPGRGFSALDLVGEPFHDPAADAAFTEALRVKLDPAISCSVLDLHINDAAFADAAADEYIAAVKASGDGPGAKVAPSR